MTTNKVIPCTVDELAALFERSSRENPLHVPYLGEGIYDSPGNQWAVNELAKMRAERTEP